MLRYKQISLDWRGNPKRRRQVRFDVSSKQPDSFLEKCFENTKFNLEKLKHLLGLSDLDNVLRGLHFTPDQWRGIVESCKENERHFGAKIRYIIVPYLKALQGNPQENENDHLYLLLTCPIHTKENQIALSDTFDEIYSNFLNSDPQIPNGLDRINKELKTLQSGLWKNIVDFLLSEAYRIPITPPLLTTNPVHPAEKTIIQTDTSKHSKQSQPTSILEKWFANIAVSFQGALLTFRLGLTDHVEKFLNQVPFTQEETQSISDACNRNPTHFAAKFRYLVAPYVTTLHTLNSYGINEESLITQRNLFLLLTMAIETPEDRLSVFELMGSVQDNLKKADIDTPLGRVIMSFRDYLTATVLGIRDEESEIWQSIFRFRLEDVNIKPDRSASWDTPSTLSTPNAPTIPSANAMLASYMRPPEIPLATLKPLGYIKPETIPKRDIDRFIKELAEQKSPIERKKKFLEILQALSETPLSLQEVMGSNTMPKTMGELKSLIDDTCRSVVYSGSVSWFMRRLPPNLLKDVCECCKEGKLFNISFAGLLIAIGVPSDELISHCDKDNNFKLFFLLPAAVGYDEESLSLGTRGLMLKEIIKRELNNAKEKADEYKKSTLPEDFVAELHAVYSEFQTSCLAIKIRQDLTPRDIPLTLPVNHVNLIKHTEYLRKMDSLYQNVMDELIRKITGVMSESNKDAQKAKAVDCIAFLEKTRDFLHALNGYRLWPGRYSKDMTLVNQLESIAGVKSKEMIACAAFWYQLDLILDTIPEIQAVKEIQLPCYTRVMFEIDCSLA